MLQIIAKRKVWFIISGTLCLISLLALIFWGLKPAIDFTGGSLMEIEFNNTTVPHNSEISEALVAVGVGNVNIQAIGDNGFLLRLQDINEEKHQEIIKTLREKFSGNGEIVEARFESIGPAIGKELTEKAAWAIVLASILIIIYIAWAFRKVSKPVASWKYGTGAVIALLHDTLITCGVFAILGHFYGVEVDILFVTALLTILGYSVNDTIVVYDRIRENLYRHPEENYETVVNRSVNETITRSINTSMTVMIVLLAIFFFGGITIHYFALALIIGIFFGTYSSIFVASALMVAWNGWKKRA
ncbi:MAG: protein translocase subunit SecF [Patescibacteria group bacterium]